ncbi:MAG: ABC transporter substrate-binding protein, partial [Rubricoccaceae bacterium]|nr:ABC transporter substrate-binding protein [Rubricoccaceae bacterium]
MKRRDLLRIIASGLILAPLSGFSQQSGRVPIVGFLITHPPITDPVVDWLRGGLAMFGYEDGRNVRLEVRTALGQIDRVPALAKEMVDLPADVIVVVNDVAMRALLQLTDTIPIVSVGYTNDPLGQGWIASYRRPGGNVTGVFTFNAALGAKRLEIIKETLPEASRIAVLWDPAFGGRQLDEVEQAAPRFGLELYPSVIRGPTEIDQAYE